MSDELAAHGVRVGVPRGWEAELEVLDWEEGGDDVVLQINMDGAAEYTTASLDDGRRLRISFADTALSTTASVFRVGSAFWT